MTARKFKKVFVFLDTDKHASPFDILTTIDVFQDVAVLHYNDVSPEDAEKLVYDIIFPRGPEGAKHTKIFINGHDFKRANEILEAAKKCMLPPFEVAIIIDPRGAYTTAAATVAKTLEMLLKKKMGNFQNKTVSILAGTGPVGETAARLYASEGAHVIVTSRDLQRALAVAVEINENIHDERVRGVKAQTPEEIGNAIENADIVVSTGPPATQLLPIDVMKEYGKKCRIVADANAIPPLGIEGLDASADCQEILSGIFGIGALSIGKLKQKVEAELIRRAAEEPKGIFDYQDAYKIAKIVMERKQAERRPAAHEKFWLPS